MEPFARIVVGYHGCTAAFARDLLLGRQPIRDWRPSQNEWDWLGHGIYFWEFQSVRFQYLYVGLPALDAIQYVQGDNWLGAALAALMRIPPEQVAWLGAEALRRIQEAPLTDQQRFLLGECVQAYLPLDEAQRREFERLVATEPYTGVQAVNKTWFEQGHEQGLEQGIEKGEEKGRRAILREQLDDRFGPLPPAVQERFQRRPADRLPALARAVLRAQSLRDLGLED